MQALHEKRVKPMISVPNPARRPNCEKPRNCDTSKTMNEPPVTIAAIIAGRPA